MAGLIRKCTNCGQFVPIGSNSRFCPACAPAIPVVSPVPQSDGGRPASKPAERLLPASIGDHTVEKLLGTGGMGDVYLVREPVLGRQVALKLLRPELRASGVARKILEEAAVSAKLTHPGIVPIYRVGNDQGMGLYYTMKYVTGRSLADVLTGVRDGVAADVKRYSRPALLEIFLRICEAMSFAHHLRIVHRDLKPANVMLGEFGEVLVMDWGLSRIADEGGERLEVAEPVASELGLQLADDPGLSRDGAVLGTPGYMSPEQAGGHAAQARPPSDVYALGAILYQILTMRLPVDGRPDELMARTIKGPIIPPEKRPLGQDAPRVLCQIATRALALQPDKRHAHAGELAEEIRAYLNGDVPWSARQEGWQTSLGRWAMDAGSLVCAEGPRARLLSKARLPGDLRLHAKVVGPAGKPSWRLDISIGPRDEFGPDGYLLRLFGGEDARAELLRENVLVSRASDLEIASRQPHEILVTREADALSLEIDGRRVLDFRDVFPPRGPHVGFESQSLGLRLSGLRVENKGVPLRVDFSEVPDQLMALERLEEARVLYLELATSHADRSEGYLARFKAALCALLLGQTGKAAADFAALKDTSHQALEAVGRAKIALATHKIQDAWAVLTQELDRRRGDPLRVPVWTTLHEVLAVAEKDAHALASSIAVQLLRGARLEPHETSEICGRLMRIAAAKGGPAQARAEALALLQSHPTQLGARMELHSYLAHLGLDPAQQKFSRTELQKSLDLKDQITRRDRARLLLWTIESFLSEGQIGEAEKRLSSTHASVTHPSSAGLWARNWRALASCAQGKWPEAAQFLQAQSALYADGRTPQHFLGILLESVSLAGGHEKSAMESSISQRAKDAAEWKTPVAALTGRALASTYEAWCEEQPRESRGSLLLAGSLAFAARRDGAAADALCARATREADIRAFAVWFGEKQGRHVEGPKTIIVKK
ncbi:MAG: serine/threonine-protein kinase [Planctomycetota bacterium]